MTQTSPIGRRAAGTKREIAILATEAAIDKPKRLPASRFLNDIARDALAAVLRDDAVAIADLPTVVVFRAFVVQSRRYTGYWRLIITTKAYGAWGHCKSGPIANRDLVVALAEMINGPAPAPAATPNLTNPAKPTPSVSPSTWCADRLGVLGALFITLFGRWPARMSQPSAAAEAPLSTVRATNSRSNAKTDGDITCALSPSA